MASVFSLYSCPKVDIIYFPSDRSPACYKPFILKNSLEAPNKL